MFCPSLEFTRHEGVTDKKEYTVKGSTRYALKGKTADGRNLTKFVSKTDYDKATV